MDGTMDDCGVSFKIGECAIKMDEFVRISGSGCVCLF